MVGRGRQRGLLGFLGYRQRGRRKEGKVKERRHLAWKVWDRKHQHHVGAGEVGPERAAHWVQGSRDGR